MRFLFPQYVAEEEKKGFYVGNINKLKNDKIDFKKICLHIG